MRVRVWDLPPEDRDECRQEVWQVVCQQLPGFEYDPSRGKFRSWLFARVSHKSIDTVRRRARDRAEPLGALLGASQEPCSGEEGPEAQCEHHINQEIVQAALAELRQEVFPNSFAVLYML
ncbi:MAG: hypothetical protein HY000_16205, partial [Planctomycetes bacterium]|nr:hypothetical protein [Planctomycetota bacterium]